MVEAPARTTTRRLPVWRIGLTGGLVGILCCVGPTVLAALGIVSAGTAFVWATDLYGGYAWWFRLAGVVVLVLLVWRALRRRDQCSVAGLRRHGRRIVGMLGVAVATYLALYGVTTWLGTFA
jgi:membrane protein implicated in regulation of membrane protease activity